MKIKMITAILCAGLVLSALSGCGLKMPDSDNSPGASIGGDLSDTSTLLGVVSDIGSDTVTINLVSEGAGDAGRVVTVGDRVYGLTGGTYLVTPDTDTIIIMEHDGYAFGMLSDIAAGDFLAVALRGDTAVVLVDNGPAQESDAAPEPTDSNSGDDVELPPVSPTDDNEDTPSPSAGVPDSADPMTYTITTDGLKIRSGPDTTYSVLGVFDTGSRVTGIVADGWLQFTYEGQTAYSSAEYVKVSTAPAGVPDTGETKTYTTTDNLTVRSGPGTSYSTLGVLEKGTKVTGTVSFGWLKFTYEGSTSYCSASYLSAG